MSFNYKNQELKNWLEGHHAQAQPECQLVEDVEKVANVWYIKEDYNEEQEEEIKDTPKTADMDAFNPLYSGQSERIKKLKQKKVWIVINPIYRLYATVKVRSILFLKKDKKAFFVKLGNKIKNKWHNRKSVIRKRNRAFIRSITYSEERLQKERSTKFTKAVKFSVIVPLFNTPERYLRDMIESVLKQTYSNLELCLGDASDTEHIEAVARICNEYAAKDERVHYEKLAKNAGIADNTNNCIKMASGDYIALLDHDDLYHEGALFACMERIEEEGAEFIYTDEMTFEKDKIENIATLHFKPDFSMQNLKGVNYICHLCVFKKSLLDKTGMFDDTYNGSQDHDIILKLTSAARVVSHVPDILYFWRVHPMSVSMNINAKSYAIDAGRAAVRDNEKRSGREAEVFSSCICATHYRLEYAMEHEELVSILIANQDDGTALAHLVDSICTRSRYQNYEIIIVDFDSTQKETKEYLALIEKEEGTSVVSAGGDSLGRAFNRAAAKAKGSCAVFLEANMEITKPSWLNRLVPYVMQDEIGVMGQRLVNEYGMMEEAGYIAGLGADGIALAIEHGNHYSTLGYMGRMYYVHNVSMVSLWGMMVRLADYKKAGGLDETLGTHYAGLDYCLRALEQGKQVALDPYVINYEYKKPLRGRETEEAKRADRDRMKQKWNEFLKNGDPYYNKNLAKDGSFTYNYK